MPGAAGPYGWHPQLLTAQLGPTAPQTTTSQLSSTGRSVPGIVNSVAGRRPHTGVRLRSLINQNSHAIPVPELCAAPQNVAIPTVRFQCLTYVPGNCMRHFCGTTTRGHKEPQAEGNSSPGDAQAPETHTSPATAHIPGRHNCQKHGALHPIWGTAPDQGHCTRTEEVHCLRIGCSAPTHKNKRGTGAPNHSPPHPSMRTWALLAAGWARRPRHHLHSGPLRPTPAHSDTSYTLKCEEPHYDALTLST